MVFIYVLKLQKGKYYVGKTSNPQFRLESHFNHNGSEWTKIYKPTKIIELISNCDDYDEDKYTKIYMDRYGIENVRGGSYTSIQLDTSTKKQLIKISNSTNNRCFQCGKSGHFAKDCYKNEEDDDNDDNDFLEDIDLFDLLDLLDCCDIDIVLFDAELDDDIFANKCIVSSIIYGLILSTFSPSGNASRNIFVSGHSSDINKLHILLIRSSSLWNLFGAVSPISISIKSCPS
jgi:hypothetical protein